MAGRGTTTRARGTALCGASVFASERAAGGRCARFASERAESRRARSQRTCPPTALRRSGALARRQVRECKRTVRVPQRRGGGGRQTGCGDVTCANADKKPPQLRGLRGLTAFVVQRMPERASQRGRLQPRPRPRPAHPPLTSPLALPALPQCAKAPPVEIFGWLTVGVIFTKPARGSVSLI